MRAHAQAVNEYRGEGIVVDRNRGQKFVDGNCEP